MAQNKFAQYLGIVIGSPFLFIGIVFMLTGKVGVGLPFVMLGLVPVLSKIAAARKPDSPEDGPEASARGGGGRGLRQTGHWGESARGRGLTVLNRMLFHERELR